eukprot:Awhi_evm1s15695
MVHPNAAERPTAEAVVEKVARLASSNIPVSKKCKIELVQELRLAKAELKVANTKQERLPKYSKTLHKSLSTA